MTWQPIETAPSDTPVLLYTPHLHDSNQERVEARVYHASSGGSWHAWATHWMPLPPPPTKEQSMNRQMLFSGLLTEYLCLRDGENKDAEFEPIARIEQRNKRMTELLLKMDALIPPLPAKAE